jgi:hypothetical protein
MSGKDEETGQEHRVGRVLSLFSSRRNWDPPTPSPANRWGGGGPSSDEGTYTVVLYIYARKHGQETRKQGKGGKKLETEAKNTGTGCKETGKEFNISERQATGTGGKETRTGDNGTEEGQGEEKKRKQGQETGKGCK